MAKPRKTPHGALAAGSVTAGSTLDALVASCSLLSLDTVASVAERYHAPVTRGALPMPPELDVDAQVGVRHPKDLSHEGAAILVRLDARFRPQGQDGAEVAHVMVEVRVAYAFAGLQAPPTEELIERFAAQVAAHHAWPFLRERARTLSVEIGMPAFLLPIRTPALQA